MANVPLANSTANITGDTVLTAENADTITGLKSFSRSTSAPFAVNSGAAKVTNLDADMVDGLHASDLGGASVGGVETITGAWTFSTAPTFGSSAIPETAIADGSLLARLAAAEQITGAWKKQAGSGTGYAKLGGLLYSYHGAVGNVGSGEDTLVTQAIPANTLAVDGDRLEYELFFYTVANGNTKTIKVKFGATSMTCVVNATGTADAISVRGTILRIGAANQEFNAAVIGGGSVQTFSTPTETLANAINFVVTGEATATDDVRLMHWRILWYPAS